MPNDKDQAETHQLDHDTFRDLSKGTLEERMDAFTEHFVNLSKDVHTIKGNLAGNTSMTREVADGQAAIAAQIDKIPVDELINIVGALNSMKGGLRVLGWLERPAKWLVSIATAAGVLYAVWKFK